MRPPASVDHADRHRGDPPDAQLPLVHRYAWPSELDSWLPGRMTLEHRWSDWHGHPFDARSTDHVRCGKSAAVERRPRRERGRGPRRGVSVGSIDERAERVHMKAVTWQAKRSVSVDSVPDPIIKEPADAIVRITSTNICGSDLHLYETLTAFMQAGDILGHEPIGIVEEVGKHVTAIKPGDRVVIPVPDVVWPLLHVPREALQPMRDHTGQGAGNGCRPLRILQALWRGAGRSGGVLARPTGQTTHIKVPEGPADDRFVYLSDVLPTAWQAVEYAAIPEGGTVVVLGLGPIGDMASRIAQHHGARVIAVDLVPERLQRARIGELRLSISRATGATSVTSCAIRRWQGSRLCH